MTEPLAPPRKRDPQAVTPPALLPPDAHSRGGHALSAMAAWGELRLQTCAECGAVQYPPRDVCRACLSTDLPWRPVDPAGEIVAASTVRTSIDPYFRRLTPWRVCTVRLPAGVSVIAHRHGDASGAVTLAPRLDRAGNAAMIALPRAATPNMGDDPILRELTAHPKHRRCLVTDGRGAVGQAVAHALVDAGAAKVFVGVAEGWKPFAGSGELDRERIETVPLDVTDERSVATLAAEIGGKTDILVNTAERVRPGGVTDRRGLALTRDEFETNVFGLMRLGQQFGPAMRARGADGTDNAVAFLHVLSVHALANDAASGFGAFNASQAAALSVLQALRAELRGGGVRVMGVLTGPPDDEWRAALPPPKVSPARLARTVVRALTDGIEESVVGETATDLVARWRENPGALHKELASWM